MPHISVAVLTQWCKVTALLVLQVSLMLNTNRLVMWWRADGRRSLVEWKSFWMEMKWLHSEKIKRQQWHYCCVTKVPISMSVLRVSPVLHNVRRFLCQQKGLRWADHRTILLKSADRHPPACTLKSQTSEIKQKWKYNIKIHQWTWGQVKTSDKQIALTCLTCDFDSYTQRLEEHL